MFDEFFDLAIDVLGEITDYEESEDAFIFYNDKLEQDGVIVILKDNAKVLSMVEYIVYKSN